MDYQSFSHKQGRDFFPTHVIGLPLSIQLLGSLEFRCKYVFVPLLKFSYYILILFILASQLEES